jgi:hypothetical protein
MRVIRILLVAALLGVGIVLLIVTNQNNLEESIGSVILVHNEKNYVPYQHWVYSQDHGIAADGINFSTVAVEHDTDLKEGLDSLEAIPVSGNIKIIKVGNDNKKAKEVLGYRIFDDKLNEIMNVSSINELVDKTGLYYIVADASWGNDNDKEGYQYIFKIMLEE